jgi:hypothetical protein
MTELQFWRLIKISGNADVNWSTKRERMRSNLKQCSRSNLIDFAVHFQVNRKRAFTPGVLCGAFLWNRGWLTYDSFLDFTDCLVATCKRTLTEVIIEPDRLERHPELADCPEMHFHSLPLEVFVSLGENPDDLWDELEKANPRRASVIRHGKLTGLGILRPEVAKKLTPRLFARFGADAFA